jgi:hypothetical protein
MKKSPSPGRSFGFSIGGVFLLLTGIRAYRHHSLSLPLLGIGVLLILLGALAPRSLEPINRVWMKFGERLSKVTAPIFLGVFFFDFLIR